MQKDLINSRMKQFYHSCRILRNQKEITNSVFKVKTSSSLSNTGFKIKGIRVKGPAILIENELFNWNVPQFGLGGADGAGDPLETGKF